MLEPVGFVQARLASVEQAFGGLGSIGEPSTMRSSAIEPFAAEQSTIETSAIKPSVVDSFAVETATIEPFTTEQFAGLQVAVKQATRPQRSSPS